MPVARGFDWFDRTPPSQDLGCFSEPACVSVHVIACEMRVHANFYTYASFYTVNIAIVMWHSIKFRDVQGVQGEIT